ncbi:MAG TPA: LLM class F420-dependent oxidoreductase, partial [Candidatus Binataceae bacterium]
KKAEELGYESLWIPEHILMPIEYKSRYPYANGRLAATPETPLHDPMLALAYVAAVTTRIKLATGVFVVPLRNPYTTAKAVASLDTLSGGRFIFGIGIGWLEEEFAAVGMNFEQRAARAREYVALMKEIWTQDTPRFEGKTQKLLPTFKCYPHPVQKPYPPLVFGGNTEASYKRAAQLGDGWYGIAENIDATATVIARLREHERNEKRDKPLEITLAPRLAGQPSLSDIKRLKEIGADRLIIAAGMGTKDSLTAMERFRDQVIAKF